MKTVCVIRHGKSSWEYPQLSDLERPLKKRGVRDAKVMGDLLLNSQVLPQEIFSSPAVRAYTTAQLICDVVGYPEKKIIKDKRLYFTGVKGIMEVIHEAADHHKCIYVFCHNPDITQLANHFAEHPIDNVPTTGLLVVSFDVNDWNEADYENGKLELFDYPSRHRLM